MRNLLCVMLCLLAFSTPALAIGANDQMEKLRFEFYIIPTAGPEKAEFEVLLKNNGDIPLNFEFPTSQQFEITVNDYSGEKVYLYSKGKYFLQAFQTIRIEPHKTYKRMVTWDYQFNGKRVPEGDYTVHVSFKPIRLNDEPIKNRDKLNSSKKMHVPEENPTFQHVKVEGIHGKYVITGETRPEHGKFYYNVEDGHEQYWKETQILTKGKDWEPFQLKIEIPESNLPDNGSIILYLYERTNDGTIIHSYPIVLERFY